MMKTWYGPLLLLLEISLRFYMHTMKMWRGRFARIYIEIGLKELVVGRVGLNGDWYKVQYKGLHIICT